jgi:hypothetical protein
MSKKEFVDEFLDTLYLIGHKEDGKYYLTISEATLAAEQLFATLQNDNKKVFPDEKTHYYEN